YAAAAALDHAVRAPDPAARRRAAERFDLMTPLVKAWCSDQGFEIASEALQVHGGMGYTRELPIERWYRELRLLRIYEGTDEIQRRTIARTLLKGHASVRGHLG
ncbi:MAG: acyl-CoA dehydrogenase family protein, partial [Actinomycetes bacterium]